MVMVFFTGLSGCLDNACDIQGEIDNSLGYTDDVVVHLVIKDCKTCPWQIKASAYAYQGMQDFCFVYDGDAKLLFDDAKRYLEGDEISEDIGTEFTAGEYKFTVDADGVIRDSAGNLYSFF